MRQIISTLLCLAVILLSMGCQPAQPATATSVPASAEATSLSPTASKPEEKTPLVVFAAGSLIIPFDALEKAFEARYPQIDVLSEYHGSIQVIRHATELHEQIDIVATADAALIPMLMFATTDPETQKPYANWYIRFATNRLALAYRPESVASGEINATNWPVVLARPEVKLGLADPRFDASGYRALMAVALAEELDGNYTYFERLFGGQFKTPITIFRDEDITTITVPEVLETANSSHILLRGSSIQLIALLETGDLDYAFEYESVIQQHGLNMLSLPDEVNLGSAELNDFYQQVQVNLNFQRFVSIKPEFRGEQIGYGVTIPSNAAHPDEAELWLAFLLGPEGRAIMESNHHPLFSQPVATGYEYLPEELQTLCIPLDNP
jgi:molybdate/tungstate transport system substrate-binding protein